MTPLYDEPVWSLMHEMVSDTALMPGEVVTKDQTVAWFKKHYPKVKKSTVAASLSLLSTNDPRRVHYHAQPDQDDVFFKLGPRRFRLYDPDNDPPPIYSFEPDKRPAGAIVDDVDAEERESAYESDLRDFLSKNLGLIESGLELHEEEGVRGVEFPAGGRYVDILAKDKAGDFVVIELKVSRGYDRVVGQLLGYVSWVIENLAEEGQSVRGFIIARNISDDLLLACRHISGVELFEYELSVLIKPVSKNAEAV